MLILVNIHLLIGADVAASLRLVRSRAVLLHEDTIPLNYDLTLGVLGGLPPLLAGQLFGSLLVSLELSLPSLLESFQEHIIELVWVIVVVVIY